MQPEDEKCPLYFQDLRSRNIPETTFPEGYTLQTWQEGAENIWISIVKGAFGQDFIANWTSETFIERYFSKPQFQKDGFFLVKHDNDFIATAFAWLDEEAPSQGILHWLAVLPEHRRKGIAQSLCYCVLKYHKDHGKTMALLKTEVYRKHALQLYDKLGFTKTLKVDKDISYYYFRELQSRNIPEPELPLGYSLHMWNEGDEEIWLKIVQEAFGHEYVSLTLGSKSFTEKYFSKPQFKKDGFFLVKKGKEDVATVMAWQDEVSSSHGRLAWLAVSAKHRRKGIAQALCHCVLKYHKDHGKTYTWLRVSRFRTREIAKKVYEKVGFKME